jgi:hypothetical protein
MVARIVSGGQTGVDRAALDAAVELGIAVGGWCPRGRRAEDGRIPDCYPLTETPNDYYRTRTRWNVRDSDFTLVLTNGAPAGGTLLTVNNSLALGRPHGVVDMSDEGRINAEVSRVRELVAGVRVLNVAGPRESESPGIYAKAKAFLRRLLAES